ncbi:MAG: Hydroperoxy fatty acid reductase 1 [Actinomycetota bacterium]|jgi:glutathione peroxidase
MPALCHSAGMTILDLPISKLDGTPSRLADLGAKAYLVVNVASKCGLTPQYTALEALQEKYSAKGFTVVGVPCNQFGAQEPGSPEEIATFCSTTYGVTFPMTEKVEVNGSGRHAIYGELTKVADGEGTSGDIRWNFEKFLVAGDGRIVARYSPMVAPDDPSVVSTIESLIG